ncbi:chromosome transmission fidelity protein 18 homolog [Indicator indicator]|uniref:chromosome transmission fidelity protein 18 homolog n=1 Tax=Indicator indicator TaxID=1002788 RepID=UPI0023E033F4|nr:chromosome transmission fidelity protein 18 homolog [Indicator indicator]
MAEGTRTAATPPTTPGIHPGTDLQRRGRAGLAGGAASAYIVSSGGAVPRVAFNQRRQRCASHPIRSAAASGRRAEANQRGLHWRPEARCGRASGAMAGPEEGPEDGFYDQFAAELEVLAELGDDPSPLVGPKISQFRGRNQPPEEPERPEDLIGDSDPGDTNSRKRDWGCDPPGCSPPPAALTPKPKRQRLEAVKKLSFGVEDDLAPDVLWDGVPGSLSASQASRNLEISGMAPLQTTPPSEKRRVLKRPPVLEDYINVTSTEGTRVFMVLRDDPSRTGVELPDSLGWNARRPLHLLGVPFSYLKEQVDEKRRRQVLEASEQLTEVINSCLQSETSPESPEPSEEVEPAEKESAQHCLWVDKFAPRRYIELLSDDYTNRCLLKWLKLWDTVVFGKEKAVKKAKPSTGAHPPFKEHQTKWKTKVQLTEEILEAELDQHKRPKYKVALLCGPPGLGKTTLAHVIARHAGYNPVEMNASDDRSPEVFRTRIEAATQMRSVLGAQEQPNCLIIDEIDGAPAASISVLLSIIQWREAEGEGAGGAGQRRRRGGGLLLRPIICICNDQYVPALRPLRQQSFLLSFPRTSPARLAQRLCEIALRQGMRADTGALLALCEKAENDIRACINTLQFLHSRGQKELNIQMVQTIKIGLKDQNKGLFSIWQEIFQLPRVPRHRLGVEATLPAQLLVGDGDLPHLGGAAGFTAASLRFHRILHLAISSGEQEKLAQGLHENFLNMKLQDSSFSSVCLALEWLGFCDLLSRAVLHGQSFQLLRYLPFLPVAFHLLFAATSIPRLAYPSSQHEALAKLNHMQNLVLSLVSGTTASARSRAGQQPLVLEVLCLLLDIIAPKLRPVNTQLYSLKEKQQLADLVSTMLAYNLTYQQERLPEGQYGYRLDPNVEDVCRFPDLPARRQLSYQTKQLIAREIELEKMRRTEAVLQARSLPREPGNGLSEAREPGDMRPTETPNHQQRLEHIVRRAAVEEKPETDFFGRPLQQQVSTTLAPQAPREKSIEMQMGKAVGRSDVWFRFNEGVSNAVRRNIYIRDLL